MKFWRKHTTYSRNTARVASNIFGIVISIFIVSIGVLIQSVLHGETSQRVTAVASAGEALLGLDKTLWWWIRWASVIRQDITRTVGHQEPESSSIEKSNQSLLVARQSVLQSAWLLLPQSALTQLISTASGSLDSLMGSEDPQSYLILLQNTNEKRPNGGFFGSYGLITLSEGRIENIEFRDSYLPWFDRPWVGIQWPEWLLQTMPTREIHFVWANKIGFTYQDGWHITQLYELAYPSQQIRWVVFLRLDMILQLLPEIQDQVHERQFINAITDQIPRDSWQKKTNYLNSLESTVQSLLPVIIQRMSSEPERIGDLIDIYLTDIPGALHGDIREAWLTNRFEDTHGYFRDSNISFSKTDQFVDKRVVCREGDRILLESTQERIDLSALPSNTILTCEIRYWFEVPEAYTTHIYQLEKNYWVTLWTREKHILWIDPKRWSRGVAYLWNEWTVSGLTGSIYDWVVFDTPFAQALSYKVWMTGDAQERRVQWKMIK